MNKRLKNIITLLGAIFIASCGSGGGSGSSSEPTFIEGIVRDLSGQPISDFQVYIFETYESTLTDESGSFSIQSYKHLSSVKLFFQGTGYTNTVDIGSIPEDVSAVHVELSFDKAISNVSLSAISFLDDPTQVTPTPEPIDTPRPGKTPAATPTPKPGNYDADGNTSSFGIPTGQSGNITAGKSIWNRECHSCHVPERTNRSYGQIKAALRTVPAMRALSINNKQVANLTAYLNRSRR